MFYISWVLALASASAMSLNKNSQGGWVKPKDCSDPKGDDEIALNEDLSNVSPATCMIRKAILDPGANYCPDEKPKKKVVCVTANGSNKTNATVEAKYVSKPIQV